MDVEDKSFISKVNLIYYEKEVNDLRTVGDIVNKQLFYLTGGRPSNLGYKIEIETETDPIELQTTFIPEDSCVCILIKEATCEEAGWFSCTGCNLVGHCIDEGGDNKICCSRTIGSSCKCESTLGGCACSIECKNAGEDCESLDPITGLPIPCPRGNIEVCFDTTIHYSNSYPLPLVFSGTDQFITSISYNAIELEGTG